LASTLGLRETAVALAKAVVANVTASGATEVLVLSPADRWTFEHVYPKRLGVEWPASVQVREVVTVLADAHAAGRLRIRQVPVGTYAYHDPCHTPRLGTARPAPRALLSAAFGATGARNLFFREHRAHPCGAVGGLDVTHRAIADRLAAARIEDAKRAGAEVLVTDDPTCLQQLTLQAGAEVAVKDLYQVLADRT
jgi:Fe-S oxidoreductase